MSENFLEKLFEHNNWANDQIIQACAALSDAQLDAEPVSATKGNIRETLRHLVASQLGYLSLLTGKNYRADWQAPPPFPELQEAATAGGERLLALARGEPGMPLQTRIKTRNGYLVEPWVVMVQVVNHATEHREQIKSMLSALGVTPPDIDGWSYGEVAGALTPTREADG
jgi:uncharacterized damage-inducible protein DinB